MQALPIFLDKMFNEWVAVILSVTFVLAFGEVKFSIWTMNKLFHNEFLTGSWKSRVYSVSAKSSIPFTVNMFFNLGYPFCAL